MVVYINVSKRILHPQVQEYRDVTGIALGDFYDMFNDLDLADIHRAQDVNEAAELLTQNINLVLLRSREESSGLTEHSKQCQPIV